MKGSPCEVVECQDELLKFHREHFSAPAEIKTKSSFADDDIIQKAMNAGNGTKFKQLWEGDHSNYPSQSEADLALCCMLAFWTQGNTYKIDQLFRQSGLFRSKWDRSFGEKNTDRPRLTRHLPRPQSISALPFSSPQKPSQNRQSSISLILEMPNVCFTTMVRTSGTATPGKAGSYGMVAGGCLINVTG